jgi:hypothetical protein
MPTIKYSCNVCGKVHDTEKDADLCENSHPKLTFVKATDYNVEFEDDNKAYPRHILCTTETGDTLIYGYNGFVEAQSKPEELIDPIPAEYHRCEDIYNILRKAEKEFTDYNIISTGYGDMYCRYNKDEKRKEFIFFNDDKIIVYIHSTPNLYSCTEYDINDPQLNGFKNTADGIHEHNLNDDVTFRLLTARVTK